MLRVVERLEIEEENVLETLEALFLQGDVIGIFGLKRPNLLRAT